MLFWGGWKQTKEKLTKRWCTFFCQHWDFYNQTTIFLMGARRCEKLKKSTLMEKHALKNGCTYIAEITYAVTRYGDTCTIGIFHLRSDLTHNLGVVYLISVQDISSKRMIRKLFLSSTRCLLGPFDSLPTPWQSWPSSLA